MQFGGHVNQHRARRLTQMDVLMRVDMRWILTDEPSKTYKLPGHLIFDRFNIIHGNYFIQWHPGLFAVRPLAEINVDTETQPWVLSAVCGGFRGSRPAHHQTRARYNAMLMRFEDATVHAGALAEIIRVDDQMSFRNHSVPHQFPSFYLKPVVRSRALCIEFERTSYESRQWTKYTIDNLY